MTIHELLTLASFLILISIVIMMISSMLDGRG